MYLLHTTKSCDMECLCSLGPHLTDFCDSWVVYGWVLMDMASYCLLFLPNLCFCLPWPNFWLSQTPQCLHSSQQSWSSSRSMLSPWENWRKTLFDQGWLRPVRYAIVQRIHGHTCNSHSHPWTWVQSAAKTGVRLPVAMWISACTYVRVCAWSVVGPLVDTYM